MTATLTRLKIAGFKSFAEPVSLDILPGLTGIVGPNGCGKSNVVEALRWAMGETSAKSLRGGDMDDVIFAGTTARASRNLAEVTITLERGAEAELPAPWAAEAELAVTRRIERGAGSRYRANGQDLRARDVQTLYADLASGARSSGMVSQGRVAALVGANPEERRQVLEEAAGITGLHARRHEAELKLRATEQNLARAEDLRTQLETTREALRKQARQAARYRNISGLIRAAEADYLAVLHGRAAAAHADAEAAFSRAREKAEQEAEAVTLASGRLADAEAPLTALRADEAALRTVLERRRLEAETLAEDADRAARALADAQARRADIEADLTSANHAHQDAEASVARLREEVEALKSRLEVLPEALRAAEIAAEQALGNASAAEAIADAASVAANTAAAAMRQAVLAEEAASQTAAACVARHDQVLRAHGQAQALLVEPARLQAAEDALAQANEAFAAARAAMLAAELARTEAAASLAQAQLEAERRSRLAQQAAAQLQAAQDSEARLANNLAALRTQSGAAEAARVPPDQLTATEEKRLAAETAEAACEQALEDADLGAGDATAARLHAARALQEAAAARDRCTKTAQAAHLRTQSLDAEITTLRTDLAAAEAACVPDADRDAAEIAWREAENSLDGTEAALVRLAQGRARAEESLALARAEMATCLALEARLTAEAQGLAAALAGQQNGATVLDSLAVPDGLEQALAACLTDAALASPDPQAPLSWRDLHLDHLAPELPACAVCATDLVGAPGFLGRALAHVGVIDDEAQGDALQATLLPGQILVTKSGAAWRWDGLVRRAGAPDAAATRLQQRAQMALVAAKLTEVSREILTKQAALQEAEAQLAAAIGWEEEARAARTASETSLRQARETRDQLAAQAAQSFARCASLRPALARLQNDQQEAAQLLASEAAALADLPELTALDSALQAAATALQHKTAAQEAARIARQQARAATAAARSSAQALALAAAQADSHAAAFAPQLERMQTGLDAARLTQADAAQIQHDLPCLTEAQESHETARHLAEAANQAELQARAAQTKTEDARETARAAWSKLQAQASESQNRLAAQETMLAHSGEACRIAQTALDAARDDLANTPDAATLAAASEAARAALAVARSNWAECDAACRAFAGEHAQSAISHTAKSGDLQAWQVRLAEAARRSSALAERCEAATRETASLAAAPDALRARAAHSVAARSAAELAHKQAADALAQAEADLRAAGIAQREADGRQAGSREAIARAEGLRDAAQAALDSVLARAAERLGAEISLPDADDISQIAEERGRKKFDRLTRERDEMGPVNLRAEMEVDELDTRITTLEADRDELTTGIAKLRGAIGHLNREGRERLSAVFTEVDRHFRTLFTRMMGGGRAHLALTGSEDPLEAGLEIYAEPPGKKLSALSLLSGGEQALTALSLIFAVFRCTPAPISVLDEVDAPLDDANVERFCTLLDDVVRETGTRFLVVTHHQVTMARMDRLFGVTMQERGVSRLLSVDLQRATAMVEQLQAAD